MLGSYCRRNFGSLFLSGLGPEKLRKSFSLGHCCSVHAPHLLPPPSAPPRPPGEFNEHNDHDDNDSSNSSDDSNSNKSAGGSTPAAAHHQVADEPRSARS